MIYVWRGAILPIYLVDAAAEILIIAAWGAVLLWRKRGQPRPAIFHSTIVAENIVRLDGNANPTGKDINDLDTGILTPTFQYSIDVDNSFNNFIGINDTITIGLFTFDFNGFVDDRNCTGSPTTCNWVGTVHQFT